MKIGYIDKNRNIFHCSCYRWAYPDAPVLSNERLLKRNKKTLKKKLKYIQFLQVKVTSDGECVFLKDWLSPAVF